MNYVGDVKDNAETVYASGCTGLAKLDAPNAEYVYASGCTGLTKLDAPNAETVDASGCTGLTFSNIKAPIRERIEKFVATDLKPLLAAGGRLQEALDPKHWECHSWDNCPMAAAFGVSSVEQVPALWRDKAEFFVRQFDCGLIRREMVPE